MFLCRDGNLVSADSFGRTQFWDPTFGTLLHGYRQHDADVLSVVVDAPARMVYASGIDNKIVQFRCVPYTTNLAASGGGAAEADAPDGAVQWKWMPVASTRAHSHDVRALAVVPAAARQRPGLAVAPARPPSASTSIVVGADLNEEEWLVSGGVDTQLCVYRAWAFSTAHASRHPVSGRPRVRKVAPVPNGGRDVVALSRPAPGAAADADAARPLMLVQHARHLEVWRLGAAAATAAAAPPAAAAGDSASASKTPPANLPLAAGAVKVATIGLRTGPGDLHLTTSALSPDGAWAACTNGLDTKVFHLSGEPASPLVIRKQPELGALVGPVAALTFSADSTHLIAAGLDSCVRLYALASAAGPALVHTFAPLGSERSSGASDSATAAPAPAKPAKGSKPASTAIPASSSSSSVSLSVASVPALIRTLVVSADGRWLAAGDVHNRISVYDLTARRHVLALPALPALVVPESPCVAAGAKPVPVAAAAAAAAKKAPVDKVPVAAAAAPASTLTLRSCTHTALAFHPTHAWLVVALSTQQFVVLDLAAGGAVTPASRTALPFFPAALLAQEDAIQHIAFNPARPSSMLLVARSFLCHVDLDQPVLAPIVSKKRKAPSGGSAAASSHALGVSRGENFRLIERYKPVVHAGYTAADTLVVVEAPWVKVVPTLPDQLYRGAYGRK